MTRRQMRAQEARPTGWRVTLVAVVLAVLLWGSSVLERFDAWLGSSIEWMDEPGPASDDIAMQLDAATLDVSA